jgi:hypothetical protein
LRIGRALLLAETACIPKLVGKITTFLHLLFVVADICPLRCNAEQAETKTVGPIFRNEIKRVR